MSPSAPESLAPRVAKAPFFAAAVFFLFAAALILALAIRPLGAAELIGLLACVAAAAVFVTIPFAVDFTRQGIRGNAEPRLDLISAALAEQISAAVEARLAASEERRREELLRAAAAAATPARSVAAPASARPLPSVDDIAPPAASAKPRLGRGLSSLIHNPSALTRPAPAPAGAAEEDRAAA
jgi:hypothetical protein